MIIDKFRPLGDRVLVKVNKAENKTDGGIILTEDNHSPLNNASVIAIGSGKLLENGKRISPQINVGDTVTFAKYHGLEIKDDYLLLKEDEIIGVIGSANV